MALAHSRTSFDGVKTAFAAAARRARRCRVALLLCGIATLTHSGAAQTTAPPAPRTTLSGVYSDSQAARGKNVYYGSCRSCHSTSEYTGARYKDLWEGHTLLDVFTYIKEQMPSNEPGSLPPESVVDVIAYLLNINTMPAGKQELTADSTQLKSIRVVAPASRGEMSRRLRDFRFPSGWELPHPAMPGIYARRAVRS
jgi:mono/diheme cytochrome c family protein